VQKIILVILFLLVPGTFPSQGWAQMPPSPTPEAPIPLPSPPLPTLFELAAGEGFFSQNAQYDFAQVGTLIPINSKVFLHAFAVPYYLSFSVPSAAGPVSESFNGLNAVIGLRFIASWGYWEGDLGAGFAQEFLPNTITFADGIYAQTELAVDHAGPGDLDILATYTGFIQYLFVQTSYTFLIGTWKKAKTNFDLGPEVMVEGNNSYWSVQEGISFGAEALPMHSFFALDAGIMQSRPFPGTGEYEGFSWSLLY
jgi:hypothetical protein